MFLQRPLTCLFILATVSVDAALFWGARQRLALPNEGVLFYILNFGVPAQFGALAIWSVFGHAERLTRAAWLTLALGCLLCLMWSVSETEYRRQVVAFTLLQVLVILLAANFMKTCGLGRGITQQPHPAREHLRVSLIEIFGWSILVALWAFAARFAEWQILFDPLWWFWLIAATSVPLLLVPVFLNQLQPGTRMLRLMVAYLSVMLIYALVRSYDPGPLPFFAFALAITQITYITAWWAVMRLDEVIQERRGVVAASRETLSIYDPQEDSPRDSSFGHSRESGIPGNGSPPARG